MNINVVGGSFAWPPSKEEEEQGPTATPMYIDPQNPPNVGREVGSLISGNRGASVQELLGLPEKVVPTAGPLAHSAPSPKPNQNGSSFSAQSASPQQYSSPVPKVQQQPHHQSASPRQYASPIPKQQQTQQVPIQQSANKWNETLNANKCGAATNAEDFTKQFMADMFGGGRF